MQSVSFKINAGKTLLFLGGIIFGLAAIHLTMQFTMDWFNASVAGNAAGVFNMNNEVSVPTWFSQSLLLIVAALCLVTGKLARTFRRSWFGLAALMLFLSIGEGASIHELFAVPISQVFDITSGPLYYSWIILYAVLFAGLAAVYLRFYLSLSRRLKWGLAAAVGIFLLGAVGFEAVGADIASVSGEISLRYSLAVVAEESLEMLGSAIAIYALIAHLAQTEKQTAVAFKK